MSTPQLSDEQIEALFEANKAAPGKILRVTIGRAIEQAATAAQAEALAAVTRERDALRASKLLPIDQAPEGVLVAVYWTDSEDPEHPDRHDLDYLEDGAWYTHSEHHEHYMMVGTSMGPGPKEQAPYTHFQYLATLTPTAPGAQADQGGEA